jgi:hypothetical protein
MCTKDNCCEHKHSTFQAAMQECGDKVKAVAKSLSGLRQSLPEAVEACATVLKGMKWDGRWDGMDWHLMHLNE